MAVLEINRNPSQRELRWFGVIVLIFCGAVGLILRLRFDLETAAWIAWAVGALVAAVFYAVPPVRRALYVGWMYLFYPVGFVLSLVVLGVIYYLVLTPIGLVLRLLGRDSMGRRPAPDAQTYWIRREAKIASERYFRQF